MGYTVIRLNNIKYDLFTCCFILIFIQSSFVSKANEKKVITMAFGYEPAKSAQYKFYELLYTEAFDRLGYEFSYIICPLKRCSHISNSGRVDGEPQRILNYNAKYLNLVRVKESINITRVIAYSKPPIYNIDNWDSLKRVNYRVEYVRGAVQTQLQLEKRINSKQLSATSTTYQGLRKLQTNRSDIFIDLESRVSSLLVTTEFSESGIVPIGVLDEHFSYPFLHKKHSELALKLEKILRQLKRVGIYEKLKKESISNPTSK